jgi:hypothetical protein
MRNITNDFIDDLFFEIEQVNRNVLPQRGNYFWIAPLEALTQLRIPLNQSMCFIQRDDKNYFLCYTGVGPQNILSNQTLPERIINKHLKGYVTISTFRKSIASLLRTYNEAEVSSFILLNFRLIVREHHAPWSNESSLIQAYCPPLNIKNNRLGWFRNDIKEARRQWHINF